MRPLIRLIIPVLALVGAGCSSDPTTSDEYAEIKQQFAEASLSHGQ